MDDIDLRCDFLGSKQKAFNEACCAFARTENMAQLAERLGMNATMLRNKLNPEQPHVLSCTELITISKISGNHSIVNVLLIGLGVVTAHIPLTKLKQLCCDGQWITPFIPVSCLVWRLIVLVSKS
ncbi:hypothetical protein FORC53_4122 [Vibrio vulnificus]|uniref:Uncharacterized protein n=1 Tax=Vibrio vulnificus TaxID=672 RepID=A0AAN1PT74_VIBVL|nr:hypothetical protein FORC53_4122 [Vibrio vulnificus]